MCIRDSRFGQVLQHGENAAVPVLRGTAHIRRDFPDFGLDCVKQAGQVAHDTVDPVSYTHLDVYKRQD